jgi:hypothetical protein
MAFRIRDSVVRGEIDNRIKGIISGKIWVEGRDQPVILNLKGNAHPDLAGCLLTFTNCGKRFAHPHLDSLTREQLGVAGDVTASRKARVFEVRLPINRVRKRLLRGSTSRPQRLSTELRSLSPSGNRFR